MNPTNHKHVEKDPRMDEVRHHMKAAHKAWRKSIEAWLPDGYLENRRNARKEILMALRSVVDLAIERTEKLSKED